MKKIILFGLLLGYVFSIFPFSAKGQDSVEIFWAKHIKKALDNRPNPTRFSEYEAQQVLTGEKPESQVFKFSEFSFRDLHFQVKEKKWSETYSRSYTASKDGWWYTNTKSFDEGEWVINWSLCFALFLLLLLFIFTNVNLKKRVMKTKKSKKEIIIDNSLRNVFAGAIVYCLFFVFVYKINIIQDARPLIIILFGFILFWILSYLRITRILNRIYESV